jgi:dihydroorotase
MSSQKPLELELRRLADMHVHFRHNDLDMLNRVIEHTANVCQYAVVMPNTVPPTISPESIVLGRHSIACAANRHTNADNFKPLMMIKMEANCTPEIIKQVKILGAVGTKSYPEGVTTNSAVGLSQEILENPPKNLLECWDEQQANGMISSWHGEMPKSFVMDAEADFLMFIKKLSSDFPKLKIVLEHITTAAAVDFVAHTPNVAATITYHHLRLTLDDVLKHSLRPHNYCKPVAKRPEDKTALINAVLSGHPRFFLGSDSAPHMKSKKECDHGCAGVYTAPVLAQGLVDFFGRHNAIDKLDKFACVYGAEFYGLLPSSRCIMLVREEWKVPDMFEGIVPFHAGETLNWKLVEF